MTKLRRYLYKLDKLHEFAQEFQNDFVAMIWIIKWVKWYMNKSFDDFGGYYKATFNFKNLQIGK